VSALTAALRDGAPRVRFFAAQSLAKVGSPESGPAIIAMLRENADQDEYLRHAAVLALASGSEDSLARAAEDNSSSVRLAALLAQRRLEKPEIARFLADADPALVKEAARAINDVPIPDAYGALAKLIDTPLNDAQLALRVINANYRAGTRRLRAH
jgi:HEAT repeat protein